jgi:hypothetical protein
MAAYFAKLPDTRASAFQMTRRKNSPRNASSSPGHRAIPGSDGLKMVGGYIYVRKSRCI